MPPKIVVGACGPPRFRRRRPTRTLLVASYLHERWSFMLDHYLRRHALSIVLSVAFILMSYLCVQQGRTIASQQTLIHALFQDSLELNAIKVKHIQDLIKR